MDLIEINSLGDRLKVEHSTDMAFVHARSGGFSMCMSFNRKQCEDLARVFSRAAILIEQHEATPRPAASAPEAA